MTLGCKLILAGNVQVLSVNKAARVDGVISAIRASGEEVILMGEFQNNLIEVGQNQQ